jgi:hypothetical protein
VWNGPPNVIVKSTDEGAPLNPVALKVTSRGAPGEGEQAVPPSAMGPKFVPAKVAAGTAFVEVVVVLASTVLFCTPIHRPRAAKEITATAKNKVRVD